MTLRRWLAWLLGGLVGVSSAAAPASAVAPRERLRLTVVEVAGGRAYLSPGPGRGVKLDDHVAVGRQKYRVVAASAKHVVVDLGGRPRALSRGQHASVWTSPHPVDTFATRPAPPSLHAFEGKWLAAERPAATQTPRFVPLGVMKDERRSRAAFMLDHSRIQPLSGDAQAISRTRLRAVLHAELARRFALDADASVELWQADDLASRRGEASRPLLQVRQLELSYRGEALEAALGRLRYASATLGMLDGGRASAALGSGWAVAAFGGALPDPLDTGFETQAARFGGELLWHGDVGGAPTRASLTAQGSRFQERLDERRLSLRAESFPAFGQLGARAELSLFDRDNPWNAQPAELTALGGDATFRVDSLRFGLSVEARRPERSYLLASVLPAGYFCVAETTAGNVAREPCLGGDLRSVGLATAAWEGEAWTLDAGASAVTTRGASAEQASAFFNVRRREILGVLRAEAGASVSSGSLLESAALQLGLGAALLDDRLDASAYYRPSVLRYRAGAGQLLEHGVGARVWWAAFGDFDTSVSADLLTGPDVDVLFLQAALAWRPRF